MLYFLSFLLFIPSIFFASSTAFIGTTADANDPWIRPASLTKLILVNQALNSSLEPSFKTTAHIPECKNYQCTDPVIISLKDPFLSSEQVETFVEKISKSIHVINSDIHIQYHPADSHQTGIFSEERYECFSATPTGVDLDQNCIRQNILPDTNQLTIDDLSVNIKRHSWAHCPHQNDPSDFIQDERQTGWIDPNQKIFHLCDDDNANITLKSHVSNTKSRFKKTLSDALTKYHIQHQDIIFIKGFKTAPIPSDIVLSETSLDQILTIILKKSNNFAAQFLYQQMGAPKLDTYLFDGSGLSRYNLIQPHKLNANIQSLIQHHAWIKKYMLTEKNLKITMPSNTHLYYKTGTLFPVKNIAGLIERPNHPPLFFTLTCTHPKSKVCQQAHKDKIKDLANLYIKN